MTVRAEERPGQKACDCCLRRAWLLSMLSARLEYRCVDRARLIDLLALGDEQLIEAIGGRRSAELRARYARFRPAELDTPLGIETVCKHHHRFPSALDGAASAPCMLYLAGGTGRLSAITSSPVVAIVGSTRATDYGIEMAQSLARGTSRARQGGAGCSNA